MTIPGAPPPDREDLPPQPDAAPPPPPPLPAPPPAAPPPRVASPPPGYPPPPSYPPPYAYGPQPTQPKPPTNLVWAIVVTLLCCLPFGVVSIVYAAKVDQLAGVVLFVVLFALGAFAGDSGTYP